MPPKTYFSGPWLLLLEPEAGPLESRPAYKICCHPYAWTEQEEAFAYARAHPTWEPGLRARFLETVRNIKANPFSGLKAREVPGLRKMTAEPYYFYYQIRDVHIHLLQIRHLVLQPTTRRLLKLAMAKNLSYVPFDLEAEFSR